MGIGDRPTAPRSPWQNGYIERLIGSIRQECLDHVFVVERGHLRRILRNYVDYYNRTRTHLVLRKDAPLGRPLQVDGSLSAIPVLGGLNHEYVRMA
jgi:transposase InsO family protein